MEVTHGRGLSGARALHMRRTDSGWTLDERWNYPANDELVNETLLALADLKALEARTAQTDWHRSLGLVVPEDLGAAVRFRVSDGAGREMAALLLGKEQQSESEATQEVKNYGPELRQFYVRREDSTQSWLARGRLPRNPDIAAWIDPRLPRHDAINCKNCALGAVMRRFQCGVSAAYGQWAGRKTGSNALTLCAPMMWRAPRRLILPPHRHSRWFMRTGLA